MGSLLMWLQSGLVQRMTASFCKQLEYDRFEASEFAEGWLLGDSGYPVRSWLMTPIDPHYTAESRYNNAHKQTRCIIEKVFWNIKVAISNSRP